MSVCLFPLCRRLRHIPFLIIKLTILLFKRVSAIFGHTPEIGEVVRFTSQTDNQYVLFNSSSHLTLPGIVYYRYDTYLIRYTCTRLNVSKSRILEFFNKVNVLD